MNVQSIKKEKELKRAIAALVHLAKEVYPALEYDVEIPGYEEEDAGITFFCPLRFKQKIRRALSDRRYELLSEKDIFIGTSILPPNHKQHRRAS